MSIGACEYICVRAEASLYRESKFPSRVIGAFGRLVFIPEEYFSRIQRSDYDKKYSHLRGDITSSLKCRMFSKYLHFSWRDSRVFSWLLFTSVATLRDLCPSVKSLSFSLNESGLGISTLRT